MDRAAAIGMPSALPVENGKAVPIAYQVDTEINVRVTETDMTRVTMVPRCPECDGEAPQVFVVPSLDVDIFRCHDCGHVWTAPVAFAPLPDDRRRTDPVPQVEWQGPQQ